MATTFTIQGKLATTTNDTFIQQVLNTGLTGTDTTAFRIKDLILEYPSIASNSSGDVQFTRGTKAGIVDYSDASLILKDSRAVVVLTSGGTFQDKVKEIAPQGDLIVVETQIYLGWKTTGFGALAQVGYKLVFEEIKITADQRISILSSRLP